ncbi:MAG TPA: MFS transporter, partial [Mycobacterium sp.]
TVVLAIGLVFTIAPLTTVNLSALEPAESGIAAAIQNAVGQLSAVIAVACVGVIAAGTLSDASFFRLLQVGAVLFFIGAAISGITITNPDVLVEPVPNEVAAAPNRDWQGAQSSQASPA